ncbi:MAG TPA: transcription termination/antitermination NusG family protein [Pyrinomonadaceae bacterium]|nr:transcription termination/antitermination NusG family protein [Pyrinomonadaceae bacterium]
MHYGADDEPVSDNLNWYAVHTHPREETRAAYNLRAWQVETFDPKIRKCRLNPFTGAAIYESKPLFPRYIFARFDVRLLSKVCFTRGVHRVVSFGLSPAPVDDEIIAFIKSQIRQDGFIELGHGLKSGEDVMIMDGPLKGLIGIFEREMNGADRAMVLLKAISYQGSIVIEKSRLKSVNSSD